MIYVEQKIYNDGSVSTRIIPEEYAKKAGYYDGYVESTNVCDIYVDVFPSLIEAQESVKDIKNKEVLPC